MAEKVSEKFKLRDAHYGITAAREKKGTHPKEGKKRSKASDKDEE